MENMEKMSMERAATCCFTGHRSTKLPWGANESDERCLDLKMRLYDTAEAVYLSGMRHFICGMAYGCDLYFCEAVMLLREEYPDITIEAAIPWEGQADRWDEKLKRRYLRLISECDYETQVQKEYSADCMMGRNRYMVDQASLLIAAYNGSQGGTMNTILYAMRQGVQIVELPILVD